MILRVERRLVVSAKSTQFGTTTAEDFVENTQPAVVFGR